MAKSPTPAMLIDKVDKRDHVIGRQRRSAVERHHAGFRVCHVLLEDDRGGVWLQRLSAARDRHPLRWGSSVAGYLFAGESYRAAAQRRLFQELGIAALPLHNVCKLRMTDRGSTKFIVVFRGVQMDPPPRIDKTHIAELRLFPVAEIRASLVSNPEMFTPTCALILRRVYQ